MKTRELVLSRRVDSAISSFAALRAMAIMVADRERRYEQVSHSESLGRLPVWRVSEKRYILDHWSTESSGDMLVFEPLYKTICDLVPPPAATMPNLAAAPRFSRTMVVVMVCPKLTYSCAILLLQRSVIHSMLIILRPCHLSPMVACLQADSRRLRNRFQRGD